jgi:RNA polymerase sigma-70 factor (ECF subfamily)
MLFFADEESLPVFAHFFPELYNILQFSGPAHTTPLHPSSLINQADAMHSTQSKGLMMSTMSMMVGMADCAVSDEENESDAAILRRIRKGEPEAFEILVARYKNRVFGILTHYERDAQKVEDLAQDTFLKAWRNLKQYRAKSPFEHWLSRIASNVARDHLRRIQRRIRETSFEDLGEGSIDWLSTGNINRQLKVREARQLLEYAMQALTPLSRVILTQREIEGRSLKEVSELTGQSVDSVKVRCHRAKIKMREALQQLQKKENHASASAKIDWQPYLEVAPLAV